MLFICDPRRLLDLALLRAIRHAVGTVINRQTVMKNSRGDGERVHSRAAVNVLPGPDTGTEAPFWIFVSFSTFNQRLLTLQIP